ncbi:hypothetical protein A1O1_04084 [Capronia coronata CBS 617.96]|uniref:Uncharacterized protein n=1 Tax=Capronia coronata CBS 617.96 TaxID=1182541 RepID=W9YDM7_9EURO|nr:uncharacterized protein A1O1_04084 [Capronia coronata CBS 617.96]EXJ90977.1 hypothetical protein A1O1_04084 [Capronia coronata CBS 617.96]
MSSTLATVLRRTPAIPALKTDTILTFNTLFRSRQVQPQTKRFFASSPGEQAPAPEGLPGHRSGVLAIVPFYYIFHSNKVAGSEHAKIQESRRKHGTSNETRDPRDSPVKTLGQQKARDGK